MRLIPVEDQDTDGRTVIIGWYPSPDPPDLGAICGFTDRPYPGFVVQDTDGSRWLVSDLTSWYASGRADRLLQKPPHRRPVS